MSQAPDDAVRAAVERAARRASSQPRGDRAGRQVHNSPTGVAAIRVAERRARVWELRKAGLTVVQIAEQLGVVHQTIHADLQRCMQSYGKLSEQETDAYRQVELARIDTLWSAWWQRALGDALTPPSADAVRVLDQLMSQRCKLLGLYAPAQARVDISVTLDQIIGSAPAAEAAVEANRSEREAFLAGKGKPVPLIEGEIEELMNEPDGEEEDLVLDPPAGDDLGDAAE